MGKWTNAIVTTTAALSLVGCDRTEDNVSQSDGKPVSADNAGKTHYEKLYGDGGPLDDRYKRMSKSEKISTAKFALEEVKALVSTLADRDIIACDIDSLANAMDSLLLVREVGAQDEIENAVGLVKAKVAEKWPFITNIRNGHEVRYHLDEEKSLEAFQEDPSLMHANYYGITGNLDEVDHVLGFYQEMCEKFAAPAQAR